LGPTRRRSSSIEHWCAKPLSVTVALRTVPVAPETEMVDGYGFALPSVPEAGTAIFAAVE